MTGTADAEAAAGRIYHLTTTEDWDAAQAAGLYSRSTRDTSFEDVGFIHCSLPSQLAEVAQFVYDDCANSLVVLVLDVPTLEANRLAVRYEDGGNGQFYPHVYAPLPCPLVQDVLPASFDPTGRFVLRA